MMKDLTSEHDLDDLLHAPDDVVLLKHGAHCPISAGARDSLGEFTRSYPDVPVYGVEVTGHRALSDLVADRLGVPHQSPQLFVLRGGRPVWHAEHFAITPEAIAAQLAR
jgi:bacillithiol system protein YtxJ